MKFVLFDRTEGKLRSLFRKKGDFSRMAEEAFADLFVKYDKMKSLEELEDAE